MILKSQKLFLLFFLVCMLPLASAAPLGEATANQKASDQAIEPIILVTEQGDLVVVEARQEGQHPDFIFRKRVRLVSAKGDVLWDSNLEAYDNLKFYDVVLEGNDLLLIMDSFFVTKEGKHKQTDEGPFGFRGSHLISLSVADGQVQWELDTFLSAHRMIPGPLRSWYVVYTSPTLTGYEIPGIMRVGYNGDILWVKSGFFGIPNTNL